MQTRSALLAALFITATACSARALSLKEGISASLRQGDLINWKSVFEISFFDSSVEAKDANNLLRTVQDAIRARETRIAEAYDYILRYKELPRITVSERISKVRQAQETLNQRALCPTRSGYRTCKAYESDKLYREQWFLAVNQQPQDSKKLQKIVARWNSLGHRREVAIAQSNLHNLVTLEPDFLFFDLQQDFLAYSGSWIDGNVGPLTLMDVLQVGEAERWKSVEANGLHMLYTVARLQRPWFDFGSVSIYFWALNRASPAGPDLKLANGADCSLPLSCVPQWVILARSDLSSKTIQVLGTIDVRSPMLPRDQRDWQAIGKDSVSRSISFSALLDALDSSSF